jgi:outer membrane protein assembly factor BamA
MRATSFLLLCAALVAADTRPAFAGQETPAASTVESAAPAATPSGTPAADAFTRAALLAAARDQKGLERAPVKRSLMEKGLYWYDNQYLLPKIFGKWKGIHLGGGGFPAGAGMKFGVAYDQTIGSEETPDRANRFDVNGVAARSTRGYQRVGGGVTMRRIGGRSIDARVWGQTFEFPQEDLFGIGQDSGRDDRTNYLHESTETGAELRWSPKTFVTFSGGVAYLQPTIGSGTDPRFPSTELRFDEATLPGLTAQPDFLRTDVSTAFELRDNPLHPHAGGRYAVTLSNYDDRNLGAYAFRSVTLDAQHYVPLPNKYRVIALHAAVVMTDADAGQQVPFYYQPTLGGSQQLRGFREFRFRDRNSLVMSAEYRWEASWMLDAALFVDAGKVAARRGDLNLRDLDASYGVGLRVHSNSAFVARLDLAFSREGFIPLLRFEHVF